MSTLFSNAPVWLTWTGMETDLIFNKGVDLPGFAAFTLLKTEEGRERIARYYDEIAALARKTGVGALIETVTWMANPDRAVGIGYSPEDLDRFNAEAVAIARAAKERAKDVPLLVSLQIGPRGDGYAAGMATADEAQEYHGRQIAVGAKAGVDVASAYTLGSAEEAIGVIRAAKAVGLPVTVSFTVETDGKLADGSRLEDAILRTDAETDSAAIAYAVNCAHPDHIAPALTEGPWSERLMGVVANASRQSHEELDNSEELDDGDPQELGQQLASMKQQLPRVQLVGGCCGTDMRHLEQIATRAMAAR